MASRVPRESLPGDDSGGDVILRNPKKLGPLSFLKEEAIKPGEKRVKWSESTEIREKMKNYRRSQMDIPLDYHHIALEEKREKEGVKEWRSSLLKDDDDDEEETETHEAEAVALSSTDVQASEDNEAESTDCEDPEPAYHVDLDMLLHVIKIKTTKYTVYPAYRAAANTYEEWLAEGTNTKNFSPEVLANMKSQLELYKGIVSLYERWADQDDDRTSCQKYEEITSLLKKATDLGPPPDIVTQTINDTINNEENSQKQVTIYNEKIEEIITKLDSVEV